MSSNNRKSLQLWSTSPTTPHPPPHAPQMAQVQHPIPAFVALPSQPRPQLSAYPSGSPPHYPSSDEGYLTPAEKEKADYYYASYDDGGGHWADPPAVFAEQGQGGRKGPPPQLNILQPPKAVFTEAPSTPLSPAALAFGDEASSVRGRQARHQLKKSMDWSRFSILVKEKERKGEKGFEWLDRKQSVWKRYHRLGWLGGVAILAIIIGALAYHFTHLKQDVQPKAANLGDFSGANSTSHGRANGSSVAMTEEASFTTSRAASSTGTTSFIRSSSAASSSSAAVVVATTAAVQEEEETEVETVVSVASTTTRAPARVVETTSLAPMLTTTPAVRRTTTTAVAETTVAAPSSSTTPAGRVVPSSSATSSSVASTTSARGSTATAEALRKRFFNPVHVDYEAIDAADAGEGLTKRAGAWEKIEWTPAGEGQKMGKRSEWEKIVWSAKGEELVKRAGSGAWEETELMFGGLAVEGEAEGQGQLEKRAGWEEIEFRPVVGAEAGVKRHLQQRGHQQHRM